MRIDALFESQSMEDHGNLARMAMRQMTLLVRDSLAVIRRAVRRLRGCESAVWG